MFINYCSTCIGSGVDHTELLTIASDQKHALAVANFDALRTIKDELTYVACKSKTVNPR